MDSKALFEEAKKLENAGELLEANKIYVQLFEDDSKKNALLVMIALNYIQKGHDKEFIKYASKYLEEIPEKDRMMKEPDTIWTLYHHLGIAYGRQKNHEKALENFREAIAVKSDPKSVRYAGQACMDLGHEKEAISFWKTAAKMGDGKAILALNTRGIDI